MNFYLAVYPYVHGQHMISMTISSSEKYYLKLTADIRSITTNGWYDKPKIGTGYLLMNVFQLLGHTWRHWFYKHNYETLDRYGRLGGASIHRTAQRMGRSCDE